MSQVASPVKNVNFEILFKLQKILPFLVGYFRIFGSQTVAFKENYLKKIYSTFIVVSIKHILFDLNYLEIKILGVFQI